MKNWIIKKLGGFTYSEYMSLESEYANQVEANKDSIKFAASQLRDELKSIPVQVRGDYLDISKGLEAQKGFINAICDFLKVEKLW